MENRENEIETDNFEGLGQKIPKTLLSGLFLPNPQKHNFVCVWKGMAVSLFFFPVFFLGSSCVFFTSYFFSLPNIIFLLNFRFFFLSHIPPPRSEHWQLSLEALKSPCSLAAGQIPIRPKDAREGSGQMHFSRPKILRIQCIFEGRMEAGEERDDVARRSTLVS